MTTSTQVGAFDRAIIAAMQHTSSRRWMADVDPRWAEAFAQPVPSLTAGVLGFLIGGWLPMPSFFAAWRPFLPYDSFEVSFVLLIVVLTCLVAGFSASMLWGFRIVGSRRVILALTLIGAVIGAALSTAFTSIMRSGCMHGTGPQEPWCSDPSYSFVPVIVRGTVAGLFTLACIAIVSWRLRILAARAELHI